MLATLQRFGEMALAGLPEPLPQQTDAGFKVTLYNRSDAERDLVRSMIDLVPEGFGPALDKLFAEGRLTTGEAADLTGFSLPTIRRHLRFLEAGGLLERISRSPTDPYAYWRTPMPLRARWRTQALVELERTRKPS